MQLPYRRDMTNYQSSWNKFIKQELVLQSGLKGDIGTLQLSTWQFGINQEHSNQESSQLQDVTLISRTSNSYIKK